jgi:hypothetical protein
VIGAKSTKKCKDNGGMKELLLLVPSIEKSSPEEI